MQISKKLLLLILGLSSHGASKCMGMQEDATLYHTILASRGTITHDIVEINNDADESDDLDDTISDDMDDLFGHGPKIIDFASDAEHKPEPIKFLAKYFSEQRTKILDNAAWTKFVDKNTLIIVAQDGSNKTKMTLAAHKAVKNIALNLQPGQDCSETLLNAAQEAIKPFLK